MRRRKFALPRYILAATPITSSATIAGMDDLDAKYKAILQRIAGYPVTDPAARARVRAEIEARYRRERAARTPASRPPPTV